jgi:fructose-bisphosphate aldolase class II
MLVSGRELLERAARDRCAIGAFNAYELETLRAIAAAAEKLGCPAMIALGSGALNHAGFESLVELALGIAEEARAPIAVHLDHGDSLAALARARETGMTSLMIDGSALALDGNIALTRGAVAAAAAIAVEGELGGVGGDEDASGEQATQVPLTDPREAERFARETGIASLAVAIGNAHGVYRGAPRLDFARLEAIAGACPVPLVLHGASGIPDADLRRAISLGVRKLNVNTELRQAYFGALPAALARDRDAFDLPALLAQARAAVQRVVEQKLALFSGRA